MKRYIFGDSRDPREVLAEIFGTATPRGGSPPPEAVRWARQVLSSVGIDPHRDPVQAIAALRKEDDRLGLKVARYLVSHL